MTRAILIAIAAAGFAQAAPPTTAVPAHVITLYADLDSPAAARAMVVVRAFVERHPGAASIEIHANPPAGRPRPVDRVLVAAQSLNAGLPMAELILANADRRTPDDFVAMARQLQLDAAQFNAAMINGAGDGVIATDVAAASAMQLAKGVALLIDGQPVFASLTLSDLELRLTSRQR